MWWVQHVGLQDTEFPACEILEPTWGPGVAEPLGAKRPQDLRGDSHVHTWAARQDSPVLCPGQDPWKGLHWEPQGTKVKSTAHRRDEGTD